jgi:two-component system, LytTR family, sensor kinase
MNIKKFFGRSERVGMRPIPFLGSFLIVGLLFAVQQWFGMRVMYQKAPYKLLPAIAAWELQYLLWGIFCWFLWLWLGSSLQKAGWRYILFRIVPLSIVMSVVIEMALAACIPFLVVTRTRLNYWKRLDYSLAEEFLENTAVFWGAFLVIRAIGYYQESRQKERDMSQLAVELTEARMLALRMQINPHFLFNIMNSVSSLMYSDVRAADRMLEQLCSLLRVSLERGQKQLISLHEEAEFIGMYLSLQDIRSAGRVRQRITIEPRLYDALVPTMILQPLVENAYVHGLSRVIEGVIEVIAKEENGQLCIQVRNSGVGLNSTKDKETGGLGIGLSNIRNRLRLHFGDQCFLALREISNDMVEATVMLPLIFAAPNEDAGDESEKVLAEKNHNPQYQ